MKYNIVGQAKGLSDKTRLFLDDLSSGNKRQTLDSAFVENGHFQFSGMLRDSLTKVSIRTSDSGEAVMFWMENSDIHITILKGDFESAKITGSRTQANLDKLDSDLLEIADKKEDLLKLLKTKSRERDRYDISFHIKEAEKNELAVVSTFIKSHRNSIIGAEILGSYAPSFDRKTLMDLYHVLSNDVKNSMFGMEVLNNFVLNSNKVKIGDRYIDFEQPDTNGNVIKLSQVNGDLILLEFWSSGCGACRIENPELVKIYNQYKSKGFEILGVSLDRKKENWIRAIEKDGLPWKQVSDLRAMRNEAVIKYGVLAMPFNFLINKEGVVIGRDLRGPELRKKLEELIK